MAVVFGAMLLIMCVNSQQLTSAMLSDSDESDEEWTLVHDNEPGILVRRAVPGDCSNQCTESEVCYRSRCFCKPGYKRRWGECVDRCRPSCEGDNEQCAPHRLIYNHTKVIYRCQCADGYENKDEQCVERAGCESCKAYMCDKLYPDCPVASDISPYFNKCEGECGLCNGTMDLCPDVVVLDDPCLSNPCGEHQICRKYSRTYMCRCVKGFRMRRGKCIDINECRRRHDPCGERGTCHNTIGRYTCTCMDGYYDKRGHCRDINECRNRRMCSGNKEVCVNLRGSYECACRNRYVRGDEGMCVAVPNDACVCEDSRRHAPRCERLKNRCDHVRVRKFMRRKCKKTCGICSCPDAETTTIPPLPQYPQISFGSGPTEV